ncbi:hypothetical protein A9Q86_16040 [Flavobacteriales bacterium 33_180_T64]|nr:hypothetical protein A9Q86_16040 [Flavobacteriales bacterium 33_180_T64]
MKKIIFILLLAFTFQISAQEQSNWITDNKVALELSKTQNKPILAFVTNNQKTEGLSVLNKEFFASKVYRSIEQKVILLKLDISNVQSYNVRLGIHYTKQTSAPGLALIDKYGNTILEPLVDMTPENITAFLTLLNANL